MPCNLCNLLSLYAVLHAERWVGQTRDLLHELAELAAVNGLYLINGAIADVHVDW